MILLAFVPFKVYNKSNFRGRLIHRNINKWDFLPPKIGVDLYTSSTYTPENTVVLVVKTFEHTRKTFLKTDTCSSTTEVVTDYPNATLKSITSPI